MSENFFSEKYLITYDSIYLPAQKPQKNCQDYCLVGENDNFKYAIISDGCGSSKDTDFGSRLLVRLAKNYLEVFQYKNNITSDILDDIKFKIINTAKNIIDNLGMDHQCLDATLIISIIKDDSIYTYWWGDGSTIYVNNKFELISASSTFFDCNAPYYLSYELDEKNKESYLDSVKFKKVKTFDLTSESVLEYNSNYEVFNMFKIEDNTKCHIITSDGIESFFNCRTGKKIPSIEIIKELINIKSEKGEFIQRRVKSMLHSLAKRDIYNNDDLSVCAFLIKEVEDK